MSSETTLRRRKARTASRSPLSLESLESRLALAGNVTAQLLGSTLLLTGDALGNELFVASAAGGTIAILGNGTTVNGVVTPFVTTKPVTNIVANLNGGNDFVGFSNDTSALGRQISEYAGISLTPSFNGDALQDALDDVAPGITTFSLPGNLTATMSGGDDAVIIIGNVGGSVAVNLGAAIPNTTDIGNVLGIGDPGGGPVTTRIGGGVSVVGGNQNDFVNLISTSVTGAVAVALGNGTSNELYMEESNVGSLTFSSGSGIDEVDVAAVVVRNGVSVSTGAGQDSIALHRHGGPPLTVQRGSLVIDSGADDDAVLLSIDVRQAVSVFTAGGNDRVTVSDASSVGLGLVINTADGNDSVVIDETYVGQNAVIDVGAGNDEVALVNSRIRANLFAYLGAGNDALTLINVNAFAAFLYGGTGANTLNIDAASRSGIRTLKYFQFQAVNTIV